MQSSEIFETASKISDAFLNLQRKLDVVNKKLLVCFSATPASGKSYVSEILAKIFGGTIVSSKYIWENLLSDFVSKDESLDLKNDVLDKSIEIITTEIANNFSNKLIILDRSIDRRFKEVQDWCKLNNYEIFLISLIASENLIFERLEKRERNRETFLDYKKNMKLWISDRDAFLVNNKEKISSVINAESFDQDLTKTVKLLSDLLKN